MSDRSTDAEPVGGSNVPADAEVPGETPGAPGMREDVVGGALSHDADEKTGPGAAADTQDEPAMDVHDASHDDKVAGIAAQTRLDVGTEGHERIADVLSQRFSDAGMSVTDEDRVALAKRIAGE